MMVLSAMKASIPRATGLDHVSLFIIYRGFLASALCLLREGVRYTDGNGMSVDEKH